MVVMGLLLATACSEKAPPMPAATPDPVDMTLVPYTSQEFGFRGVVPVGWAEFSLGHFQPAMPSTVPTLFGQVGLPGATVEQIAKLAALPESTGTRETSSLTWDLYLSQNLEVPGAATITTEFALTETSRGVYVTVLRTLAEDHEVLREALFLPALEALLPTQATGGDAEKRPQVTPVAPLTGGPAPVDTRIRSADSMVMVLVPSGNFEIGLAAPHGARVRGSRRSPGGAGKLGRYRPNTCAALDGEPGLH
jgi:hypothetical protein